MSTKLTTTKFYNKKYKNFDATSDEAENVLYNTQLTTQNKEVKILTGFTREERTNYSNYSEVWEKKENQYIYTPIITTFAEWKEEKARTRREKTQKSIKKEQDNKKLEKAFNKAKVGDTVVINGKKQRIVKKENNFVYIIDIELDIKATTSHIDSQSQEVLWRYI